MKRYLILAVVCLVVLAVAWPALAQRGERPAQRRTADREGLGMVQMLPPEEAAKLREKWPTMSEEERAKFMAQMRERWQNMSEEEREKLRARMRERFGGRGPGMGPEEQLQAIKVIEEQVAKLKATIETGAGPEARRELRDASAEERTKLREKLMKANQNRQQAIAAIERQISRLKGLGAPVGPPVGPPPAALVGELQAIRKVAVEEKAEKTAKRLERLIGRYQRESRGGVPEPGQRPERPAQRPQRPDRPRREQPRSEQPREER